MVTKDSDGGKMSERAEWSSKHLNKFKQPKNDKSTKHQMINMFKQLTMHRIKSQTHQAPKAPSLEHRMMEDGMDKRQGTE